MKHRISAANYKSLLNAICIFSFFVVASIHAQEGGGESHEGEGESHIVDITIDHSGMNFWTSRTREDQNANRTNVEGQPRPAPAAAPTPPAAQSVPPPRSQTAPVPAISDPEDDDDDDFFDENPSLTAPRPQNPVHAPESAGHAPQVAAPAPQSVRSASNPTAFTPLPGVILPDSITQKVNLLAVPFKAKTGKELIVTSGQRSSRVQAGKMFDLLASDDAKGRPHILVQKYREKGIAGNIILAYNSSKRNGAIAAIDAIQKAIDAGIANGHPISQHLDANAVDIRSNGLTKGEKEAFIDAAVSFPGQIIIESDDAGWKEATELAKRANSPNVTVQYSNEPHFHLQVSRGIASGPDLLAIPTSFSYDWKFAPVGPTRWVRQSNGIWTMTYADGSFASFRGAGLHQIDGVPGVLLIAPDTSEAFIPDIQYSSWVRYKPPTKDFFGYFGYLGNIDSFTVDLNANVAGR